MDWFVPISDFILNIYAKISSGILNILGQETSANNGNISSSAFAISVKKGCDAIAPMILYSFAIIFFPVNYKLKLKGIGIGIALLFVLNIIRIVSLYLIGKYANKTIFDIMHVDVWQIFFIIITVFIWVQWLKTSFQSKATENA
jgi:exosortase/archaeosortase family protein